MGSLARSCKLSPPFIPTRLTAPGSPRMVNNQQNKKTSLKMFVCLFALLPRNITNTYALSTTQETGEEVPDKKSILVFAFD